MQPYAFPAFLPDVPIPPESAAMHTNTKIWGTASTKGSKSQNYIFYEHSKASDVSKYLVYKYEINIEKEIARKKLVNFNIPAFHRTVVQGWRKVSNLGGQIVMRLLFC